MPNRVIQFVKTIASQPVFSITTGVAGAAAILGLAPDVPHPFPVLAAEIATPISTMTAAFAMASDRSNLSKSFNLCAYTIGFITLMTHEFVRPGFRGAEDLGAIVPAMAVAGLCNAAAYYSRDIRRPSRTSPSCLQGPLPPSND